MKARAKERIRALELREQGKSYSQIKGELGVSKSSLSLWLRHLPLSKERVRELRDTNEQRIEKFRNTMAAKVQKRLEEVYSREQKRLLPLSNKELLIAGLFLYWGEGTKTQRFQIGVSNTNPKVIQFSIFWLKKVFNVDPAKIKVKLHLYSDMDEDSEKRHWSKLLNIPLTQFKKPYVKSTTLRGLTFKGFGHGTCNIEVNGRDLHETIMQGLDVIVDRCLTLQ